MGWCWHIPLRNKVSVGLIIPVKSAKSIKGEGMSWERYYRQKCREIPVVNQLLEGADFCVGSVRSTRDFSYRSTQVAGPGFFLIGDAAGFIDPVFSIGVVLGLYTAYIAAWAIERVLVAPNRAVIYQQLFTSQTQGRFELARSLAIPRYEQNSQIDDLAKGSMQLASGTARALMHSAAAVTGRSENFAAMMANEQTMHDQRLINIDAFDL